MSEKNLYCRVMSDWISDPSLCWFEWQTLISGLLAVAAAGATVWYLKKQISQSEKHERDRLRRQHDAARATLPLTLSGLADTMRLMLNALNKAKAEIKKDDVVKKFDAPSPPAAAIAELQQIILSTDKLSVIQPISEIVRQIQTLWARVQVLNNEQEQAARAGLMINVNEWIIQSAQIHALIESLFDYARSESSDGPTKVAWERAESILVQQYILDNDLRAIVEKGSKKSPDFWCRRRQLNRISFPEQVAE